MYVIYEPQTELLQLVSRHLGGINLNPALAIGIMRNKILSVVVAFNNYIESPSNEPISMEANVLVLERQAVNRYTLSQLFAYPFVHASVKRLQLRCARRDKPKRKMIERLGFRFEGIEREAWPLGGDAALYSMLKRECRWIDHELRIPLSAASA